MPVQDARSLHARPYWYDSSTATQVIQAKLIGLVLMVNAFRNNKEAHPTRVRLFVRRSYQPRSAKRCGSCWTLLPNSVTR